MSIPDTIHQNNKFLEIHKSLKSLFKEKIKLEAEAIVKNMRGTNLEIIPMGQESYVIKMRKQSEKIQGKSIIVYLDKAKNLFSEST